MQDSGQAWQPPLWEADPIGFLVDRLFPDQRLFASEELRKSFPEFQARYDEATQASDCFLENLPSMSADDIDRLLNEQKRLFIQERIEQAARFDQSRFFNEWFAVAQWEFWAQISYWTAEEAVALSLGKDPRVVNLNSIASYSGSSLFVGDFTSKLQLISRAIEAGQLFEKNVPTFFLAWAERTDFPMPAVLIEAVQRRGGQIADWKTEYDALLELVKGLAEDMSRKDADLDGLAEAARAMYHENIRLEERLQYLESRRSSPGTDVSPRERKSMLTMILAMAMKKYQFDPKKGKNPATTNIAGTVSEIGLNLDEDTVRKFLNEAKGLLEDKTE